MDSEIYRSIHKIRIVTATSLFDGHDASIGIMRRILQDSGAEVIHLGHNRSVLDIVTAAIQEDVQGIAVSSYQGGHMEFFKYMKDLLDKFDAGHVKIYGGGGGVIVPEEIKELQEYGISKIFSPDDGRNLGLQGMINEILEGCDFNTSDFKFNKKEEKVELFWRYTSSLISDIENNDMISDIIKELINNTITIPIIGITGTGGAGKSSLTDELIHRFLLDFPDKSIALLSIDPSKKKTGGALLADRIRINSLSHTNKVFMRSLATRRSNLSTSKAIKDAIKVCASLGFDLILVETSGIGQSSTEITDLSNISVYVMTSDYGASTQLEKIDMIDYADIIVINKFERKGSLDALRDVRKQYRRSRKLFDSVSLSDDQLPIFGTMASQFNDRGVNSFYLHLIKLINDRYSNFQSTLVDRMQIPTGLSDRKYIVPPERVRYLAEISETIRDYKHDAKYKSEIARKLWQLLSTQSMIDDALTPLNEKIKDQAPRISALPNGFRNILKEQIDWYHSLLSNEEHLQIMSWHDLLESYSNENFVYQVRGKDIHVPTYSLSLSEMKIPKISMPNFKDWGSILEWLKLENVPGSFPYTAGVYPFKRIAEDPTRMFAGEGLAENTNKRFHYLAKGQSFARLSTAFDSVTLYGQDPHERLDIFGKIGESGVSICTVEDVERLYAGFDLSNPATSVSMTINGPAPVMLAFFMNAAIRQQVRKWVVDNNLLSAAESYVRTGDGRFGFNVHSGEFEIVDKNTLKLKNWAEIRSLIPNDVFEDIKSDTMSRVRGTVQADILKEDQAQNTCIFSTDFSLRLMGDVQQAFIDYSIRNYYSVSISGYHIAEAGANPISQLAFTLSNGFTYLEYYLSRGMHIDDFAPNFSFFFSNGLDPEYSVIGRVARRIWSIAIKNKYQGNKRSQMLKYHIQTSGRSLHAQEIDFNDIRTTLQALLAIYDNCNSLHTNAYDEALTTPTEESVRRAMAVQLIINREYGLTKNENPNQGSFIVNELTELVEEAVLMEFERLTERGGVLGAMETQYQRGKIQEESMEYEWKKMNGSYPIIGVNTFLNPNRKDNELEVKELIRSSPEEKQFQIDRLQKFNKTNSKKSKEALRKLQKMAIGDGNIFKELLTSVEYCSLGQISSALYKVGGEYRRNL